jgi:hypothetical protein
MNPWIPQPLGVEAKPFHGEGGIDSSSMIVSIVWGIQVEQHVYFGAIQASHIPSKSYLPVLHWIALIQLYKVSWYGCTKCLDTAVQSVLIRLYKVPWYGCTKCLDTAVQSALIRLYKESWYGYTKCLDTAVQSAHLVLNNHLELILKCFEIIFNYLAIDPVHMVPDLFYIYKEKRGGLDEGTILKYVSPCMQYMET